MRKQNLFKTTNINLTNMLEALSERLKQYSDDSSYVFKAANNGKRREWIVVMKKTKSTINNEQRTKVIDDKFAKFRADQLEVVEIVSSLDPKESTNYINNVYKRTSKAKIITRYEVGKIVIADAYDDAINHVCTNGIHYFKTIKAAFYYTTRPFDYSGVWIKYTRNGGKDRESTYHNGSKIEECIFRNNNIKKRIKYETNGFEPGNGYKDGLKDGILTSYYPNGKERYRAKYVNGLKNEFLIEYYADGNKIREKMYSMGIPNGAYVEYYRNGKPKEDGIYLNGLRVGKWNRFSHSDEKEIVEY